MSSTQRFTKEERLCSRIIAGKLFKEGKSFLVYPVKVVYLLAKDDDIGRMKSNLEVMMTVSKKKFKTAVKRNRIKRLLRECWRKNKADITLLMEEKNIHLAVSLIYIGDGLPEYAFLHSKIITIIKRLRQELSE